MAIDKRYKDGDRLHANVFNELLDTVDKLETDVDELKKRKDKNTWRPVKVNNTEILDSDTNTKPLNLIAGENTTISHDNNGNVIINSTGGGGGTSYVAGENITIEDNVISAVDTKYESSDFDIKDLSDSTGLRDKWNNKQDTIQVTPEEVYEFLDTPYSIVTVLNNRRETQDYEKVVETIIYLGDKPGQIVDPSSEKIIFPGHVFSGCYDENYNWVISDTGWFSWDNDYVDSTGIWKYNGNVTLYVGYNALE